MKLNSKVLTIVAGAILAAAVVAGVEAAQKSGPVAGVSTSLAILALAAVPFVPAAQTLRFGHSNTQSLDRVSFLKECKARARLLQPATSARVMGVLSEMEEGLKPENQQAREEAMRDWIERSRTGDVEAKAELAQIRVVTVDNFILATTNPATFFDTVSLANNEIPFIENTSRQEILVSYLGQDGRARKTQPIKYQAQAQCDLHVLSTEEYEYVLMDIYKGEVKSSQMANVDMARDFGYQVSKLMWPFIKAAIGPFVTTGPKVGRTFVPHSIINTKNLPTTNLLTPPSGNTTTTLWRKECMDIVLKYCAAWGDALGPGQMKPQAVYIPSSEVMGYLDQITLTSQPNTKVEEIFETGFVLTYGGATWTFIADVTLDPDEGRAYVKFNKSIGIYFVKPGMDQTFEDESIQMQKQNKGSVSMNKVVGWGLPANWKVNIAAVQYHTAR